MKYFTRLILLVVCLTLAVITMIHSRNSSASKKVKIGKEKVRCGRLPHKQNIKIDNLVWQVLTIPKGLYRLMNAYLDTRENRTIVRVAVIGNALKIKKDEIYCQFWFDEHPGTQPEVVRATQYLFMWNPEFKWENGTILPYLVTCPINFEGAIPTAVSLTANACDNAENKLQIIDIQPSDGVKKGFVVCSKRLEFNERSYVIRFIEWVHILRILGTELITVYNRNVHPELLKMMDYFHEKGYLNYYQYLEPTGVSTVYLSSIQNQMLEVMQLTDCYYITRNMFDYIAVMDTDEVIVPMREEDKTWYDLIRRYDMSTNIISFMSLNTIFPVFEKPPHEGIPEYHDMLQRTARAEKFNNYIKSIMVAEPIISLYMHNAELCLGDKKSKYAWVPKEDSLVFHYRDKFIQNTDNITIEDRTMWKYKDELIARVALTLSETGFKP